jgi:DNA topoisomerase-1
MKLIICEKNIAAERIAKILAKGKVTTDKVYTIPVYRFGKKDKETAIIGLKGHILKVDFPEEYSSWQAVTPQSLIDAQIIKVPMQKQIIQAVQKLAKEAGHVVIATDFDREGELIGVDALNKIREANPEITVSRARFSAITEQEIKQAFDNDGELYLDLASAGEARQDIDLIWGATLTRFISLASTRLGRQFLSVGRVQSPTLALIAKRELERRDFVPEPYRQLKASFEHGGSQFVAGHKTEKFWDMVAAQEVFSRIKKAKSGTVTSATRTQRQSTPPAPFNTTAFLSAAANIGLSAPNAMRIAESLYMKGYTSYPRVDNTVYPDSLDLRGILETLMESPELGKYAIELLKQKELKPTRGKKQATDHPPIHPTGVAPKGELDDQEWKVYELIVRRYYATLAPVSVSESMRVDIDIKGEPFFTRGSRVIDEGWLHYYHYSRKKDEEMPAVSEGDTISLVEIKAEDKETTPPARYSQSKLIQEMEELHLGTKATRHEIIRSLYERGYMHSDPIIPTDTGIAVAQSLSKFANKIATPEMTAELEHDMDAIAEGRSTQDSVVNTSRKMLSCVMAELENHKTELGEEIRNGIRNDKVVGPCPKCGSDLKIIRSRKTRKRFIGCSGYPNCSNAFPLPQFGEVIALGEMCETCGSPKVKVLTGKGRPWILCIDPKCPTKEKKAAVGAENVDGDSTSEPDENSGAKSRKPMAKASGE